MSGLYASHLKALVVRPALIKLGAAYASEAAVNLVTGTALAESGACYLKQLGAGPALGIYQMEPATAEDIWQRWLMADAQADVRPVMAAMLTPGVSVENALVWDLRFATAMCRLRYRPAAPPLPDAGNAAALAGYHAQFYNRGGAANAAANTHLFQQAIAA
jgi:hypothetical protein